MSLNLDKSHWNRVAFGDVVRNVNDYFDADRDGVLPYVAGPNIDPGEPSVASYGATDDDEFPPTFKRMFRSGDVLLHSRGIDKLAAADRSGVTGEKLFVLRSVDETVLLQEYLIWLLLSPQAQAHMKDNLTGSVNKFLNWKPLAALEIDIPPLDEQKRIADLLWAVQRHRLQLATSVRSVVEAVDVHLRVLWEAETGKRAIGEVADCVTGSTPSKSNEAYWNSRDVPFYTPSEIDGDTMDAARQRVSAAGASAGRQLPEFAVAVACIGGDMGKSAVIREPGISNQQITSIVGLTSDDAYLMQSILAHPQGRLALEARETTTIVRKLNKSDLMKVKVPWPEDRLVVRQLVKHKRGTVAAITQEAHSLRVLVSALLAEIFGGN